MEIKKTTIQRLIVGAAITYSLAAPIVAPSIVAWENVVEWWGRAIVIGAFFISMRWVKVL